MQKHSGKISNTEGNSYGEQNGADCDSLFRCHCGYSCKSNLPVGSSSLLPSPAGRKGVNAANDYTQPYLTDDKVTKLIHSMQESRTPLRSYLRKVR